VYLFDLRISRGMTLDSEPDYEKLASIMTGIIGASLLQRFNPASEI
jgi:hypothetical protein